MFRHITLKQLNSVTSIETISCIGGIEATHQTGMQEVLGSIAGSGKDF